MNRRKVSEIAKKLNSDSTKKLSIHHDLERLEFYRKFHERYSVKENNIEFMETGIKRLSSNKKKQYTNEKNLSSVKTNKDIEGKKMSRFNYSETDFFKNKFFTKAEKDSKNYLISAPYDIDFNSKNKNYSSKSKVKNTSITTLISNPNSIPAATPASKESSEKFKSLLSKITLIENQNEPRIYSFNMTENKISSKHKLSSSKFTSNSSLRSIKKPIRDNNIHNEDNNMFMNTCPKNEIFSSTSKNFFKTGLKKIDQEAKFKKSNSLQIANTGYFKKMMSVRHTKSNFDFGVNFNFTAKNFLRLSKAKKELQSIYNEDKIFLDNISQAKCKKGLPLKNYQDNLIKVSRERLSKYSIDKLNVRFKKIRASSNSVKATGQTNWDEVEKILEKTKVRYYVNDLVCKNVSKIKMVNKTGIKQSDITSNNENKVFSPYDIKNYSNNLTESNVINISRSVSKLGNYI